MFKTKNMRLRLRDLEKVTGSIIDTEGILEEVVKFRKYWFFKKVLFKVAIRKALDLIKGARAVDISELGYDEKCPIKKPTHVDHIAFKAMMELQALIGKASEDTIVSDMMAKVIAISCYQANVDEYYDSEGDAFKEFIERILNEDMFLMIGLYNHIYEENETSQLEWKKRFMSVEVPNEEMKQAGIDRMNQFNVINTIKSLCTDFNCSYDEAWQMSYALTQTNSYSKATYDHIHENLRVIKERKMRQQRREPR